MNTPVSVEAQARLAAEQNERHTWETVGKAAAASVDVQWVGYNTIDVIAEELSKARAQNARLREALEPFAEAAKHWERVDYLTWGDLRKAKAALAETPVESLEAVRAEAGRERAVRELRALCKHQSDSTGVWTVPEWAIRQRLEEIDKEGK